MPSVVSYLQQVLENITSPSEGDEDEEDEWHEVISALPSSLSAQYGGSNPHLQNQFCLHTRHQKLNHIILIQVTFLFYHGCISKQIQKYVYVLYMNFFLLQF